MIEMPKHPEIPGFYHRGSRNSMRILGDKIKKYFFEILFGRLKA
jgi:hypothetical protein